MSVFAGPEIITDGLVLSLDAANSRSYPGTGTTWTNLSGTGNNGTIVNGPTYSSTTNNGIFTFNGSNQYINVGATTSGLTTSITYSIWFRTSSLASTQTLWWDDDGQAGGDSWVSIETSGKIRTNRNSDGYGVLDSTLTISTNTWYNYCLVADGVSGKKIYINGVLDTSNGTAISTRASRSHIAIAVRMAFPPSPSGDYFNGSISVFSVHNRALSAAEISQNFNALRSRYAI